MMINFKPQVRDDTYDDMKLEFIIQVTKKTVVYSLLHTILCGQQNIHDDIGHESPVLVLILLWEQPEVDYPRSCRK